MNLLWMRVTSGLGSEYHHSFLQHWKIWIGIIPQINIGCTKSPSWLKICYDCRYVYMLDVPPSPATLGAIQSLAGAIFLTVFASISRSNSKDEYPQSRSSSVDDDFDASETVTAKIDAKLDNVWKAGLELGVWTFIANVATICGFQQTPASRGAFLIRSVQYWSHYFVAWYSWEFVMLLETVLALHVLRSDMLWTYYRVSSNIHFFGWLRRLTQIFPSVTDCSI